MKQIIYLDIMDAKTGMFICTLEYEFHPIFKLTEKELTDFVLSKRPTLRHRPFRIVPYDKLNKVNHLDKPRRINNFAS